MTRTFLGQAFCINHLIGNALLLAVRNECFLFNKLSDIFQVPAENINDDVDPESKTTNQPIPHSSNKKNSPMNTRENPNSDDKTNHVAKGCLDKRTDRNSIHSTAPLFKQYKTLNQTKLNTNQTTTTATDAIRFYQENFGVIGSFVAEDIQLWITTLASHWFCMP